PGLQDLVYRDPIDARRLHRNRRDPYTAQPVRQPMQVAGEATKRTHGLFIPARWDGNDVERRADVDASRVPVNDRERGRGALRGRHQSLRAKWSLSHIAGQACESIDTHVYGKDYEGSESGSHEDEGRLRVE